MIVIAGTLYICGTPIGNLEDITVRASRILREVKVVAAEDTRQTRKLLTHLGAHPRLMSYHEHNRRERETQLLELLESGLDIALVSDAGMPGVSDPGRELIVGCVRAGVPVVPIPGPTAFVTGMVISGLPIERIFFGGFPPRTAKDMAEFLAPLAQLEATCLFYESPHRIAKTLERLLEAFGDREAAICRELTKLHEEVLRGRLSELAAHVAAAPLKGELVIAVGPGQVSADTPQEDIRSLLEEALKSGLTEREAVKRVTDATGAAKNEVYRRMLEVKAERGENLDDTPAD